MRKFKEIYLEGKDEAKAIRDLLKSVLKLSNRDVSVKSRMGGSSSAVNVEIKTIKALKLYKKIENIGKSQSKVDRDESGYVLAGGNTFISTNINYDFKTKIIEYITNDIKKLMTDEYMNNPPKTIIVYSKFHIRNSGNSDFEMFSSTHTDPRMFASEILNRMKKNEQLQKTFQKFIKNLKI